MDMFKFEKGDRVFLVWPVKTPHVTLDGDFYEVLGVTPGHIQVNGSNLWIPKWHFVKVLKEYVKPVEKSVTEEPKEPKPDLEVWYYADPPPGAGHWGGFDENHRWNWGWAFNRHV